MNIKTQASAHNALEDPLSGATRSSKRFMLIFASIALLIVMTGVTPDEVGVFGLKFPGLTLTVLNNGLIAILALSIFTFFVYSLSDYYRFRHKLNVYDRCRAVDMDSAIHTNPTLEEAMKQKFHEEEFEQMTGYKPYEIPHRPTMSLIYTRWILDCVAPLGFAVVSVVLFLVFHVC